MNGVEIARLVIILLPLIRGFAAMAEKSGKSGEEKHAMVAEQLEIAYKGLQASGAVKELNGVEWDQVKDLILPVGSGLISVSVGIFKAIGGLVKK